MDDPNLTQRDRDALDRLGESFSAAVAADTARRDSRKALVVRGSMAVGAAAVIGILVLAVYALNPGSGNKGVPDARASQAAIAALDSAPPADKYVYSKTIHSALQKRFKGVSAPPGVEVGDRFLVKEELRAWLSMSKVGVVQAFESKEGQAGFSSQVSRAEPVDNYTIGDEHISFSEMNELAKTPKRVLGIIDEAVAKSPANERALIHWSYLVQPLRATAPPLPGSVRSAMIEDLESLGGVTVKKGVKDPSSRTGEEFSLTAQGIHQEAIFDTENSNLLYQSSTVAKDGAGLYRNSKKGELMESYLLVETRVLDEAPTAGALETEGG